MKLCAQLMMLSVAGRADQLDPGFNPSRPRLNPKPANDFPSMASFLPNRIKYDPELYARMDERYFKGGRLGMGGRMDDEVFDCGQNTMCLMVRTDAYAGLDIIDEGDFSLSDPACNSTQGFLKWEAVVDPDTGESVEMLVVDIPLDACGTTAEYDEENNKIVFSNTVRNGAFSVQNGDTHQGITKDSIVDFSVSCKYDAVYSDIDIQTAAEHSELKKTINDGNDYQFDIGIDFKKEKDSLSERMDGMMEFEDFEGDAQYIVGDPAYFMIAMDHPNDAVYLQVESCTMVSGITPLMNYTIVTDQCGDPFTNSKVVDNYDDGTSLISFTMFEFVSDIEKTVAQDNTMTCKVKLCLTDNPCPTNDAC
jgi:hypothetical protein